MSRYTPQRLFPVIIFSLLLTACGGGSDSPAAPTPDNPAAPTPVSAASLSLAYGMKSFNFSWSDVTDATYYKLLENPDGNSGFSQIGSDINAGVQGYSHEVALYHRINARYLLQSCNTAGCTDSNELTINNNLAAAVGYFKASNTEAGDRFGWSVSLSGDGNTLATSAILEDSNTTGINSTPDDDGTASSSGAVYVFTRSGDSWVQQAYIKPSSTNAYDYFGTAVSLSDDGNTLAAGSREEDGIVTNSGAVYVFTRGGDNWAQQAYIKASNSGTGDAFGQSISLSGDGNTLAVGVRYEDSNTTGIDSAPNDDGSADDSGAVYVFTRSAGNWAQQAYIKPSNTGAGDRFGRSVSLSGDGNTLAASAIMEDSNTTGINSTPDDDGTATDSGAIYVFTRSAGNWAQQAYIKPSNTGAGDFFGGSVSLSGDGNTLAAGSNREDSNTTGIDSTPNDDGNADNSGTVYVFTRSGDSWAQQAYIKPSNTGAGDTFGQSVSLNSDGNTLAASATLEDSNTTGINSAPNDDGSADSSGAIYVFTRSADIWAQQAYIKASDSGVFDYFGSAVSLSNDGDTLAAGASGEDSNTTGTNSTPDDDGSADYSGAVYLY